jgi:3',5'-cyclic AMP phosphodiesterase CpdA
MGTLTRRSVVKGVLAGAFGACHLGCTSYRGRTILSDDTRIAFITDFHYSGSANQEELWKRLGASLEIERVDLIVGGGDWISDGPALSNIEARERLRKFSFLWRSLEQPKVLIPGNHDLARNEHTQLLTFELFKDVFPEWNINQRIDLQSQTLLLVQSIEPHGGGYQGYISSDQIDWIVRELSHIPEGREIIVLTHIPLLSILYQRTEGVLYRPPADQYVSNSREFLELFNRHTLRIVLQGHLHVHETIIWGNTTFITGGALCGKWWSGAHHGTLPGYRLIELNDGNVSGRYIPLS